MAERADTLYLPVLLLIFSRLYIARLIGNRRWRV
jgi:hypothetical protein